MQALGWPRPSEIDTGRAWAVPFTACFKRTEAEIAAAIYVEACVARGDTWQPIVPRQFGETLRALARGEVVTPAPSWVTFVTRMGLVPDVLGLVEGGWLSKGENEAVVPTDTFFAALTRYTTRLCSPARPRPAGAPGSWAHPLAREIGEQQDGYPGGDIVTYRCPTCGTTWREELPQ